MKNILILSFLVLFASCAVQLSSVQKINKAELCNANTSIIAISANYRMNMYSSYDVKFFLKETTTGQIIEPQKRDVNYNNFYFSVPPGIYKVAYITITQPPVSKTILFDDSTKTVIKFIGSPKPYLSPTSGRNGLGLSYNFIILTGDKKLVYNDLFSVPIRIQPNCAYYLGEYKFEGYIEGVFNDMPNIRITKINPVPDKLESFKNVSKMAYQNSSVNIDTTTSLFKVDSIDLSKANAKSN
jgi:hypothetical protein